MVLTLIFFFLFYIFNVYLNKVLNHTNLQLFNFFRQSKNLKIAYFCDWSHRFNFLRVNFLNTSKKKKNSISIQFQMIPKVIYKNLKKYLN